MEIKAKINSLKKWVAKLTAEKSEPVKSESIIELLNRRSGEGLTYWQKLRDLKAVSKAVVYLQNNNISTIPQLDENLIKNSGIAFVDLPVTETQAEEQKEEKQPLKKRIKDYLLNFLKQIKSKLWRLLRNEKK